MKLIKRFGLNGQYFPVRISLFIMQEIRRYAALRLSRGYLLEISAYFPAHESSAFAKR